MRKLQKALHIRLIIIYVALFCNIRSTCWRTFLTSAISWFMLGQYLATMRTISRIAGVNGTYGCHTLRYLLTQHTTSSNRVQVRYMVIQTSMYQYSMQILSLIMTHNSKTSYNKYRFMIYIRCRFIMEHVSSLNTRASKCSERVGKLVFGSVILHLTVRFLLFD